MRAASRALAAGLALIAFASSGVSMVAAQQSEGRITEAQAATLDSVATCLRSENHLLVAFVIDESESLANTDPDDVRVDAARLALDNFATLATSQIAGETPTIEAYVGAFARDFAEAADWGDLADADEVDRLDGVLAGFAERDRLHDTDIPTALDAAQGVLAERAAEVAGDEGLCKLLLFFTDGKYALSDGDLWGESARRVYAPDIDLSDEGTAPGAEALGRAFVCDPGGVADRLRGDGVVTLTAALTTELGTKDQDFLAAVSTGSAGDVQCGTRTSPEYGAYLPASNVDDLVPMFDGIVSAVASGTTDIQEELGICIGDPCPEGRTPFRLEPALSEFRALAQLRSTGITVLVAGPDEGDEPVTIDPGVDDAAELAGADIAWQWIDDTTLQISGALPPERRDDWDGDWSLTFVAQDEPDTDLPARATFRYFNDWVPRIVGEPELVRGQDTTVEIEVVDGSGSPVDPADLGAAVSLEVVVTDPATDEPQRFEPVGSNGRYEVAVTSDSDSSTVDVEVTLLTTLETLGELTPKSVQDTLSLRAPSLYPALTPTELKLDSVRGTGSTDTTLTITGGDVRGCVWFESGVALESAPVSAITASYEPFPTSQDNCTQVKAGETKTVAVAFKNSESGEGVVRGTITATLFEFQGDTTEAFEIPFSFDLAPPINEAERFGLFLAILLPGVVAPIAFLALSNRRLARFRSTTGVQVARVPVLVERTLTQILRVFADGGAAGETALRVRGNEVDPIVLRPEDFTPVGKQKGTHVDAADLTFVARAPANPFGEVGATVEAHDGLVAARVVGDARSDESHLPLALPGTWAVALPSDGTPVTGNGLDATLPGGDQRQWIRVDLVAFVADGSLGSQLTALRGDLGARLSDVANVLADRVEGIDRTGSGRLRDWA